MATLALISRTGFGNAIQGWQWVVKRIDDRIGIVMLLLW